MSPDELRKRTRAFALRVIRLFRALPRSQEAKIIGSQLLRCGTSVGANYRAATRARSRAEFVAKIGIVIEEVDESIYWLELLIDSGIMEKKRLEALLKEANELTAIFVSTRQSSRS
jgi:four helix bundle protein